MPFVTGDVVPSPGEETPFKVVFKQGETVIAQWPVDSKEAARKKFWSSSRTWLTNEIAGAEKRRLKRSAAVIRCRIASASH